MKNIIQPGISFHKKCIECYIKVKTIIINVCPYFIWILLQIDLTWNQIALTYLN